MAHDPPTVVHPADAGEAADVLLAFLARHGYLEPGTAGATPAGAGAVTRLADTVWPEAARLAADGAVLVIPIGATEQHGPHLPVTTDADIAVAVVEAAAATDPLLVVAPVVAYGSSGEHDGFAGTLSIGRSVTEALLVELGRSAVRDFSHVVLACAHGGNASPMAGALERPGRRRSPCHRVVATLVGRPPRRADRDLVDAGHRPRAGPDRAGRGRATAGPPTCCCPCSSRAGSGRSAPTGCWATPTGRGPPKGSD